MNEVGKWSASWLAFCAVVMFLWGADATFWVVSLSTGALIGACDLVDWSSLVRLRRRLLGHHHHHHRDISS